MIQYEPLPSPTLDTPDLLAQSLASVLSRPSCQCSDKAPNSFYTQVFDLLLMMPRWSVIVQYLFKSPKSYLFKGFFFLA